MEEGKVSKSKPLYYLVECKLKEKIEKGVYKPGDVLPVESELCAEYNVSRITIRKAISRLEEEGLIEHQFSKTPRVKKNAIQRRANYMRGLSEELAQSGILCSSYVLKAEQQDANEDVAERMGIEQGEKLIYIERLRYGNGEALCHQTMYLREKYCPDLLSLDLTGNSIYAMLEDQYNLPIATCKQTITACMSSYRLCALLELPERTAMLKVTNLGYLKDGSCFEYALNYYIGGNYEMSVEMSRD